MTPASHPSQAQRVDVLEAAEMSAKLPAFPQPFDADGPGHPDFGGLTKREYFAALAMQGILANPDRCAHAEVEGGSKVYALLLGRVSVEFADALLAALEPQS